MVILNSDYLWYGEVKVGVSRISYVKLLSLFFFSSREHHLQSVTLAVPFRGYSKILPT